MQTDLAKFIVEHGGVVVVVTANRSRKYRVSFDANDGGAKVVDSVYRRWFDTGTVYRTIWIRSSGKKMSMGTACAVRAALEVVKERAMLAAAERKGGES